MDEWNEKGGRWSSEAWRGYGREPLPVPDRGALYFQGRCIAEGSGLAVLAVARLCGYDHRDVTRSLQQYDDPDTWGGYALRRLVRIPRERWRTRSAEDFDASDAARIQNDDDGFPYLRRYAF